MSKNSTKNIIELASFESLFSDLTEHKLLHRFSNELDLQDKHLLLMHIVSFAGQKLNPEWTKSLESMIPPSLKIFFVRSHNNDLNLVNLDYVLAKIVLDQIENENYYTSKLNGDNLLLFFINIYGLALSLKDVSSSIDFIARKCALLSLLAPDNAWQDFLQKAAQFFEEIPYLKERMFEEIDLLGKSLKLDLARTIEDFENKHSLDKISLPSIEIISNNRMKKKTRFR